MSTIQEKRDHLEKERRKLGREEQIISMLPPDLPVSPVITIQDADKIAPGGAWLSFLRAYGQKFHSAEILESFERAGWQPLPVTLVKWSEYRPCPVPGADEQIPETVPGPFGGYALTWSEPIAPLWVRPQQHGDCEAGAFYRGPDGFVYRIKVPGPRACGLSAKRVCLLGDWHFDRATARLHYPDGWHSVFVGQTVVAAVSARSGAHVDTPQGMSGAVYFDLYAEQEGDPRCPTPAQLLRAID